MKEECDAGGRMKEECDAGDAHALDNRGNTSAASAAGRVGFFYTPAGHAGTGHQQPRGYNTSGGETEGAEPMPF
eukprot:363886-Chlamydomonas_euryale.AAC.6